MTTAVVEKLPDPPSPALEAHAGPHAATGIGVALEHRHKWLDHVARTTAVLAVLAAVSSGQYAGQFSRTILAQAKASDKWNQYQATKIKMHLSLGQLEIARAMAAGHADLAPALVTLEQEHTVASAKYEKESAQLKGEADKIEADKSKHQRMGDRFNYAFVVLQAGVVLATIAASARRRELWMSAIFCGVVGVLMVANGFLLIV